MKQKKQRIPTGGEPIQWASPFAALKPADIQSINQAAQASPPTDPEPVTQKKARGRVDIIRSTAHRGGKTVTVISGFVGISEAEKEGLAKALQKACGAGGTVKDGRIEIQGDQREAVARLLREAGFRPVFAGG